MADEVDDPNDPYQTIETSHEARGEENTRWMFDYEKNYWDLRAKLKCGWVITQEGQYVIKRYKNVKPYMNDMGVEQTMAIIQAFVSKIQALSVIDEDRVYEMCKALNIKLVEHFRQNMWNYNMTTSGASVVIRMIMDQYEFNIRKSMGGRAILAALASERVIESKVEPRNRGLFGMFRR